MSTLADLHLVLFFTRGVSLQTWAQIGSLERETALYRRLRPHLGRLTFITYGDRSDLALAQYLPGIEICCNSEGLAPEVYAATLLEAHRDTLATAHILKTNQMPGAEIALAARDRFGARLVARCGYLWSWHAERDYGAGSVAWQAAETTERTVFTQADRAVVTTPAMQTYINAAYAVPPERIRVVPNYVLTEVFRPLPHIRPEPGRLAYVGRGDGQKNLLALLDALAGLPVTLVLIGSAAESAPVLARAEALGVRLERLGNLPHSALPAELARAELFVFPSLYEGHPKALIEAMACGRPVLTTDVPGIRELVVHGQTAYVCQPEPASLRAGVLAMLGNQDLQTRLGARAAAYVRAFFSLERVLPLELAMLSEVAGVTGPARSSWLSRLTRRPAPPPPPPAGGPAPAEAAPETAAALAERALAHARTLPPAEALRFLFELENRLYPALGQLAVAYGGGTHTKHRHLRYHDFFVARVRPGERVLDIGCGSGAVAYDLAEQAGAEVTGIDLAEASIAQARAQRAHPRARYLHGDALTDLPEAGFDVIVMSNVLEHIDQRVAFLRQVQARYHPDRWLLRVPLFERDWRVPLKAELGMDYRLDPTHFIEYTHETFAEELRAAGLTIRHLEARWGELWVEAAAA